LRKVLNFCRTFLARSIALWPFTPVRNKIANNSESLSVCSPFLSNFSRGLSSFGQAFIPDNKYFFSLVFLMLVLYLNLEKQRKQQKLLKQGQTLFILKAPTLSMTIPTYYSTYASRYRNECSPVCQAFRYCNVEIFLSTFSILQPLPLPLIHPKNVPRFF